MKELTLKATIANLPQAIEWLEQLLEEMECSFKAQMQLSVAMDELFSNIAKYAYPDSTGDVTIRLEQSEPSMVQLIFMDSGIPYDPLQKEDPDVSLSAQEREIGGLGIYMVKKTMDEITYEYKNGQNILAIKKRI